MGNGPGNIEGAGERILNSQIRSNPKLRIV